MDPRDLVESEFNTEVVDPKMSYVASEDASKVEQKTEKKTAKAAKKAAAPVVPVVPDEAPLQIESMTPSTGFTKPVIKLAVKETKDAPREKDVILEDGVIKYPEATDHKVDKMKLRIRLILQKMTTFNMLMKEQQQLFSTMLVDMDNISYDLKNL